jgi:tetratricopeptide (TPR) repeat protein
MPVARMFDSAGDRERALAEYQTVLRRDSQNAAALEGAGQAAFELRRYRTAERYLGEAAKLDPQNAALQQSLESARLILRTDPFIHGLPNGERSSRIRDAFNRAGNLLADCARLHGFRFQDNNQPEDPFSSDLISLQKGWSEMKPKFRRRSVSAEPDIADSVMALVFQIEERTQNQCGEPTAIDRALLELALNPQGADQ